MISTVITKPTKVCNAACTYCSAPPDGVPKWSIDDFKRYFDRLAPYLSEQAYLIWHGGEPMLMGPDFYEEAWVYARDLKPEINFSIQTNLLSYNSKRWYDVFRDIFKGSISTSFDPDETNRIYKGSAPLYTRLFYKRLEEVLDDGFYPKVISTYTEETAHLADGAYTRNMTYGDKAPDMRFNYRYPAGRDSGNGEMISPKDYGEMLLKLYDRWIVDLPVFTITPLDEMLKKVIALEVSRCPWTRSCGGHFLGLEPNGDTYNCSEFADLGDPEFKFGNLNEQTVPELMKSRAAAMIRRRRVNLPMDCTTCRHFSECEGGCMRDAVLYNHGLGGKFHYCQSWKMVFDRIKETVRNGEADDAVRKYGLDPDEVRREQGLVPEVAA
ncbi:MAG: radical SAM protein [Pseudomonadota bacterium]